MFPSYELQGSFTNDSSSFLAYASLSMSQPDHDDAIKWNHFLRQWPFHYDQGNPPVTDELPSKRLVTRIFDVLFDLHLNKRLSKQWKRWWFETPSLPLLCYCNVLI